MYIKTDEVFFENSKFVALERLNTETYKLFISTQNWINPEKDNILQVQVSKETASSIIEQIEAEEKRDRLPFKLINPRRKRKTAKAVKGKK